jgi:8-oxo-dGTP pyrophosphatase MutT (NUDIX family)
MPIRLKRLFLQTIGRFILSDFFAHRFPVSVKGICIVDGRVVLLKNERDEWDLPGGKLDKGESVEVALRREIHEELGVCVLSVELLSVFNMLVSNRIDVIIVLYHCQIDAVVSDLKISQESFELGTFNRAELQNIALNGVYLRHIYEVMP